MQSVAPTARLQRRSRDLLLAAAVIFLGGAALAVAGIGLHIVSLVSPFNRGYAMFDSTRKAFIGIGFAITLLAMLMALRAATWRTDSKLARSLGAALARQLDHQFVFIRNISKRGLGVIDAALVSKHGVLIMRISGRKGHFKNEGGTWMRRRGAGWTPLRWNPSRDIAASARKLKDYLDDYGLEAVPVYAAVVFIRGAPELQLTVKTPAVPAVYGERLRSELADGYFAESRLTAPTVAEVVTLLYR